jgi:hypothetical protein
LVPQESPSETAVATFLPLPASRKKLFSRLLKRMKRRADRANLFRRVNFEILPE